MAWLSESCGWLLAAAAAVWTTRYASQQTKSPLLWKFLVGAAVVAFRWPRITAAHEFSPDESQSLAGALTLLHDPRFWISVDGATAGPLHFFAQIPAVLGSVGSIYAISRLEAITLVLGTFFCVGRLLRSITSPRIEQATILAASLAFALSRTPDLQHFSTEVVPAFLTAAAFALAGSSRNSRIRLMTVGICAGLVPLAKLQAAPLGFLACWWAGAQSVRRHGWTSLSPLVAGALLPSLFTAAYLTMAGAWQQALIPYLLNNVSYVEAAPESMRSALWGLLTSIGNDGYVASWFIAGAFLIAGGSIVVLRYWRDYRRLGSIAISWAVVAFICVAIPSRPYVHYVHLLFAPMLLLIGIAVAAIDRAWMEHTAATRPFFLSAIVAVFLAPLALLQLAGWNRYAWLTAYFSRWGEENAAIARVVESYRKPGDALAIWGSRSDLYIKTGLWQATPEAHSQTQITSGPWQSYFLRAYSDCFESNHPAIFIDAVGPSNFLFEDRSEAHEAFPRLRMLVDRDYLEIAALHGTRIYVRKDRVASSPHPSTVNLTR